MADRLKRINYSIYLDPVNNPADLYASKVLHQWADDFAKLKSESGNEHSLALLNARNVQKQVYLSGLFMHLLSPDLSQQLSMQLTEAQVSEFTLEKTLQGLGYLATNTEQANNQQTQSELLEALKASIFEQVKTEAERTREHLSAAMSSTLATEAEKGSAASTVEAMTAAVSDAVEGHHEQNARLVKLAERQSQEIAELKQMLAAQSELIGKLSKDGISSKVGLSNQEQGETPVVDLNERLAHVQKIKKKGIF
ncbi:hypothetical protein RJ45_25900 [Photobacterium gaetbulicola]|uniref:Uncharacterized protein n=1 Tax=Photobacterium gaetbulicola TaxID=1295392 RepID=A0A0B9GML9_9GAMM|nr:hypothetical protein [Photobacterium gaetbulicola]KHT58072.1 hypothetical protein RJ45_25900 [Photobacterium gaetbulicola]